MLPQGTGTRAYRVRPVQLGVFGAAQFVAHEDHVMPGRALSHSVRQTTGADEVTTFIQRNRAMVVPARFQHQQFDSVSGRINSDPINHRPPDAQTASLRGDRHTIKLAQHSARGIRATSPLGTTKNRTIRAHCGDEPCVSTLSIGEQIGQMLVVIVNRQRPNQTQRFTTSHSSYQQFSNPVQ